MQVKAMVMLLTLFTGVASFAEEGLTREQVRAEMARAMAAGEMAGINEAWDGSLSQRAAGVYGRSFAGTELTREQVRAELQRAIAAGEMPAANEGWDGSVISSPSGVHGRPFAEQPGLTREQVVADYQRALRNGDIARHRLTYAVGGD